MRVLVTGVTGQIGQELKRTLPAHVEWLGLDRKALDLTRLTDIAPQISQLRPAWVINAAAYTQVDRAETESALAFTINAEAPRRLAEAAVSAGARFLQISTDFIFDGRQGSPYTSDSASQALNVYGQSKWAGEQAVREICGANALVLRTAWVYSSVGHNFVRTILDAAKTKDRLMVVADQIGTPTWAHTLAQAIWRMVDLNASGTHHWTDAGVASWYDFAQAIVEEAASLDLLHRVIPVIPIGSGSFQAKAKRPAFSVLDKTATWAYLSLTAEHWRHNLRAMLRELPYV